jgi:hypothetical protein
MIECNGITLLDTTNNVSVTANVNGSYKTFSPNAGLMSVEPPRLSESVDKTSYKIAYIDPNFEKLALFENGMAGARMTVMVCFRDILVDGSLGQLLVDNVNDILIAYKGRVDTQGYTISPDSGTVVAVIEGASPVAALGQIKALYTSKEAMARLDVTDTSFDEVYTGSPKVALLWGKLSNN